MSQLGDFLKKAIEEEMEFNKRLASGESVATLREEIKDEHLLIYGVDSVSYTHLTLPTKRIV